MVRKGQVVWVARDKLTLMFQDIIELNNKNIQQKRDRGRIEYILKRIDSLREWEDNNNSADKCEINYNIQGGGKIKVSDSKEVCYSQPEYGLGR